MFILPLPQVAAPIFLKEMAMWPDAAVGAFMGGYIVIYGNFQTSSGSVLGVFKCAPKSTPNIHAAVWKWTLLLGVVSAVGEW